MQRMLRMESVQKDILDKVEQTLRVEFMSNLARTAKRDAHEQMAEIFNNFDRQTESRFITALEERSRDSAERIKALMFTFEDLGKLDPGSIQTLLRHVEKDKLGNVHEAVLANYLKNEYPQTVAVVLSKVRPDHAARVLTLLPDSFAMEVVMRMLRMESVQKDVLDGVERTLRAEFMSNLARSTRRDSHEMMADIFNSLDRQAETRFLASLEERNRESAERIKALMFTFDDLVKLDAGSAQTLMRNIDKDKLAVALKGADETVRQFCFTNMSSRAAKMLVEDMQAMGPVRLRDVDEAQALVVNVAKDLALDRKVGAAIDIYVNNWLVARGEAVLVEEKLGITMT
ncbi:MAG: FliG C-terminal domain-containing protein [Pseudolabrys sp.]